MSHTQPRASTNCAGHGVSGTRCPGALVALHSVSLSEEDAARMRFTRVVRSSRTALNPRPPSANA